MSASALNNPVYWIVALKASQSPVICSLLQSSTGLLTVAISLLHGELAVTDMILSRHG